MSSFAPQLFARVRLVNQIDSVTKSFSVCDSSLYCRFTVPNSRLELTKRTVHVLCHMNLDKELFKLVGQKQKMAFQIYFNADSTISHFIVTCSRNGNSVCDLFSKFDELSVYGFLLEYMKLYHGSFPLAKVEDSDKLFTIFQTPKNETELLRILSEIYYNQQTKNVKNIYSFVGSLDSYDFEARVYDPTMGRFTAPDPLAWDTPWVSPYSYCASNPIRYIDPTGMDWIGAIYDDDIFYFFDERIKSQNDLERYYGHNSDIQYRGKDLVLILGGQKGELLNLFILKSDGKFYCNNTLQKEEYDKDHIHIGNSEFTDILFNGKYIW